MIRRAVYRVDLGAAKRGHEQRGRRYAVVLSPHDMDWSVATVVPTSRSAQPAVFRPELELLGEHTRFLADQIRSVGIAHIHGEPVSFLTYGELRRIEHAVTLYLGL